jgi:hypothetical protein
MNASEHPAVELLGYEEITGNSSGDCACGCPFEIHIGGSYLSAWTGWTIDGFKCQGCRCLLNLGLEVETPGGDCASPLDVYEFEAEAEAEIGPDSYRHIP